MLTHRYILPATSLTPEAIPLPRLPHDPRIKCGHYTGGASGTREKALTAKRCRQKKRWRRARKVPSKAARS